MVDVPKVHITIDGIPLEIEKGTLLTDAAKRVGIKIPVFCSHAKLLPLGACRMCLVELEKAPKLVTACTTEVAEKMVVLTQTPKVKRARNAVMEFFLANHPLDCPVCDAGGECELQDNAFEFGTGHSRFKEKKRNYDDIHGKLKLSPLISWVGNRCVHCERCTRVCHEVIGDDHIGMLMRGDKSIVSTFNFSQMTCELCGNCAEYCPTGTITNGAVKYKERVWNLKPTESFCTLCSSLCGTLVWTNLKKRVARVTAPHNEPGGGPGFLCAKGRYSFDADQIDTRLKEGETKNPSGKVSLPISQLVSTLSDVFSAISTEGPTTAILYNTKLSNEEAYLLGRISRRNLKIPHVVPIGNHEGLALYLDRFFGKQANSTDLLSGDLLLFIDAPLARETPVIGYFATRASRQKGAALFTVGPEKTKHSGMAISHIWNPPFNATKFLETLTQIISKTEQSVPTEGKLTEFDGLAKAILGARKPVIIAGSRPLNEGVNFVVALENLLKKLNSATVLAVPDGGNTLGSMFMAGSGTRAPGWQQTLSSGPEIPGWLSQINLNGMNFAEDVLKSIESGSIRNLILAGEDILEDFQDFPRWKKAFAKLDRLVLFDSFRTPLSEFATLVVPIRSFHEISGSAISATGEWRIARGPLPGALGQPLSRLLLKVESFLEGNEQYEKDLSWEVNRLYLWRLAHPPEIKDLPAMPRAGKDYSENSGKGTSWLLVGNDLYHSGVMTLRGAHLPKLLDRSFQISSQDGKSMGFTEGENIEGTIGTCKFSLPIKFSDNLMEGCCFVPINAFSPEERPWFQGIGKPLLVSLRKC